MTAGEARRRPDAIVMLPRAYLLMSLLLLAQLVLGMAVNLFVTIPHGWVWFAAHVSLGLALVVGGVVAIVLAARSRDRVAISTAGPRSSVPRSTAPASSTSTATTHR